MTQTPARTNTRPVCSKLTAQSGLCALVTWPPLGHCSLSLPKGTGHALLAMDTVVLFVDVRQVTEF